MKFERASVYLARRQKLQAKLRSQAALFHSGYAPVRNLPSSSYPFRANSHFLHFFGPFPPGAVGVVLEHGAWVFLPQPSRSDLVWEGGGTPWDELLIRSGVFGVKPRDQYESFSRRMFPGQALALPVLSSRGNEELTQLLGRAPDLDGWDRELAEWVIECRLTQDAFAVAEMRRAIEGTAAAYAAGRTAAVAGATGWEVLAELERAGTQRGLRTSFTPIVTTAGDVLHQTEPCGAMSEGDLLLVDFGLETESGYASDVTRTWAVGVADGPARELWQVVYEANRRAIAAISPGVLYGEVHRAACLAVAEGLTALGILRGAPESLVERGAHTLFFPHGVGHLLGLDAHDLEDLGDRAGYGDGQQRDSRFGFCFLRLNRRLRPGMVVTIEPGIYMNPALIDDSDLRTQFADALNVDRLELFRGVKGIRLEDDVLVGTQGAEVLTEAIPLGL